MSGGNKALELQMQMRQNAEDLQIFMKDLNSWEENMKKKDEQLRTGNLPDSEVGVFIFTCINLAYNSVPCHFIEININSRWSRSKI